MTDTNFEEWADALLKRRGIDIHAPGFKAYLPSDRSKYNFDLVEGSASLSQGRFMTEEEAEDEIKKFKEWKL